MNMNPSAIKYELLPESLREGAQRYIEQRIKPGSFLTAVIENNLLDATAHADSTNKLLLREIVLWWHWEAPGGCWGIREAMQRWLNGEAA